jgi:hypothetical protein
MESLFKFMQIRPVVEADIDFVINMQKNEVEHENSEKGANNFLNTLNKNGKITEYNEEIKKIVSSHKLKTFLSNKNIFSHTKEQKISTSYPTSKEIIRYIENNISELSADPDQITVKRLIVATINTQDENQKKMLGDYCTYLRFKFIMDYLFDNTDTVFSPEIFEQIISAPILLPEAADTNNSPYYLKQKKQHIPHTHGSIKPSGISDLKIVKQQLKRYESGEVVHIENILRGETKLHQIIKTKSEENFTIIETENQTSHENSISSTDRFEVSQAASESISESESFNAGLNISSSYGPTKFGATADGAFSSTKQSSIEQSSEYAKEITQQAVIKVTERVLKQESRKLIETLEDTTRHEFINTGADTNISGVYQWVDKIYEAQVFNYGKRLMYDIMVPEPAANYINSLSEQKIATAIKPIPFPDLENVAKPHLTISNPMHINRDNYMELIEKYQVTGITPPPDPFITKSAQYSHSDSARKDEQESVGEIAIDDGYSAVKATINYLMNDYDNSNLTSHESWFFHVSVGTEQRVISSVTVNGESGNELLYTKPNGGHTRYYDQEIFEFNHNNCGGSLPYSILTYRVGTAAITIEVLCELNDRTMQEWQISTYNSILNAYKDRFAEYEDNIARDDSFMELTNLGSNPLRNKALIETELKKHALTIITNQNFRFFDSIKENNTDTNPQNDEEIDIKESVFEGRYIRFFENAFEWSNMTYSFYPYFWSRKDKWDEKLHFEDNDQNYHDFVKSGFCRIALPVRPGFESSINFFMETGEVWEGEDLPHIGDKYYVSVFQELSEKLGRSQGEKSEGEPWEVKIPTSLIKLKTNDKLPQWEKTESGQWLAVSEE